MTTNYYPKVLRHVGRPSRPRERPDTPSVSLQDYEALYVSSLLEEYGYYHATDDTEKKVTLGLAEYINKRVRDESDAYLEVYLKTQRACNVVVFAIECVESDPLCEALAASVKQRVMELHE
jgi:hypothetical protein